MKIALKLELSDDQYQNLMQSSYDEIFKDPKTLDALRETVLNEFVEYFSGERQYNQNDNKTYVTAYRTTRHLVEKALLHQVENKNSYSYSTEYRPSDLMRQIVEEATKDQMARLKDAIQQCVYQILSDKNMITSVLHDTMIECFRAGISLGTDQMIQNSESQKARLNILSERVDYIINALRSQ